MSKKIEKFKCTICGKTVTIKSIIFEGAMFDYLCPKCYKERGGIYYNG